jgi:AraC-like DNA-binding protein
MRLHLVGVFALHAEPDAESVGTVGAQIQVSTIAEGTLHFELINGKHYVDARSPKSLKLTPGDGVSLETIGSCSVEGQTCRVDRITLDLPPECHVQSVRLSDTGTPASFGLFDAYFEMVPEKSCPFSGRSAGVTLSEVGVAVRVGDRVRLSQAIQQLHDGIRRVGPDLGEARGSVILFLAVVSAAKLEAGTRRPLHRFQLDAARRLDSADHIEAIIDQSDLLLHELIGDLLEDKAPTDLLINRALNLVERGYGKAICDEDVAFQLGLSTSHFRHLFKQATGQPFHKYVVALRLERARAMLTEQGMMITEVSHLVGFQSPAHFSRAFQKRFGVAPKQIRNAVRSEAI